MRLEREVAGIEELHGSIGNIALEGLCPGRNEIRIMPTPDCQQRWPKLPEIFVKFRIKLHIVGVIEKKIELNVDIARAAHQCRIECVTFRSDFICGRDT